jgi:HAMP domain-containing protein
MKLIVKFNLIFVVIFGLAVFATALIARQFLEGSARGQVVQQARLMMETSASTRKYTSQQIRPILDRYQRNKSVFYAESVPAFSATKIFSYLREKYPEYTYEEATLNPTNTSDRAGAWETDLITSFRNNPARSEYVGERQNPSGLYLYLARPIQSVESCMECHSTPDAAPRAMVEIYGPNNGFGWRLNEIVGAQIVTVPMSIPAALAQQALRSLVLLLTGFSVIILILLNIALLFGIVRPMRRLSAAANELSKGNLDVPELPVRGRDEVATLADSFNRLRRSLIKAIKMLEE